MIEKLPLKKKKLIIWLYLDGMSYDEIASSANIDKDTVTNVIFKLKAGLYPEFGELSEQIDPLRKLTLELR